MATQLAQPRGEEESVRMARRELAAAYRLAAHFGWDDQIATHFSARLHDGTFLLNPLGLLFEEITASSLIRVDMDGNVLDPPGDRMNKAAFTIHSAVLAARPDVNCVMHLHTHDGAAVSALEEGLMPLNQSTLIVHQDIAYHDFEGIADDLEERERLQRDLGGKNLMILRNHGTLAAGESIGAAFYRMYFLEWACTTQVRTLSMGKPLRIPAQSVRDHVAQQAATLFSARTTGIAYWPAMMRKAERLFPGFDA
ncbi:MAG: class II aldolase/adducin family protein [Novosphingobium sp.]|nr:class II aldolase/adducin family protein [Novosphingobium sp.]